MNIHALASVTEQCHSKNRKAKPKIPIIFAMPILLKVTPHGLWHIVGNQR